MWWPGLELEFNGLVRLTSPADKTMEVYKLAGGWSTSAGYGLLVVYMWAEDPEENNVVCRHLSPDEYERLFDPDANGEFTSDERWSLDWYSDTLFMLTSYTAFLPPCYKPRSPTLTGSCARSSSTAPTGRG